MGLLDDAIREHLELKRRRGGDPAEIARSEQEALGPVRREPEAAEPVAEEHHDEPQASSSDHAPLAHDYEDEPLAHEQSHVAPPQERGPEPEAPAFDEEPPRRAPEPEPDFEPEPERAAPPAVEEQRRDEPSHREVVDQPTTEYRVEDHEDHDDAPPASDEDVLEETPDFLQETPEHDRLWFEQRPPRDFDFDD